MKCRSFIRIVVIAGIIGLAGSSCSNEIEPLSAVYRSIPVVHSVLELQRDTLYVRLTKAFLGPGSALNYTRIEDSLYYPEARVWLEKWNGDFRVNRAELIKSDELPREPGIFLQSPNWNYLLIRSAETETLFTGSVQDQEYHLSIEIPGLPLLFAKTMAYPEARLQQPRLSFTTNLFLDPLDFVWKTEAPWSELHFRIYYSDVYEDSIVPRCATWREFHTSTAGQKTFESVFGQELMKRIAAQVKPDSRVKYRPITAIKAVVVGIPADLYDYRLMNSVQPPDQVGYPITNITNGIGLFTSQTLTEFELDPDLRSRDSIVQGTHTKHLKFRFY